jgi:hypothetical protein
VKLNMDDQNISVEECEVKLVAIPKASEYIYMLIYSDVISNAVYLYCSG